MIKVTFVNIGERRNWSYPNVRYLEVRNSRDLWIHGFDYALNQNYQICVDLHSFEYLLLDEDDTDEKD